jgi:hypothetical protein
VSLKDHFAQILSLCQLIPAFAHSPNAKKFFRWQEGENLKQQIVHQCFHSLGGIQKAKKELKREKERRKPVLSERATRT